MRSIASEHDVQVMLEHAAREPIILYKHSTTCPISAHANKEMQQLAENVPIYRLVVQDQRQLSAQLAEQLVVRHHTPQAIVIYEGEARANLSHGSVTAEKLHIVVNAARE
jgi:bacillithiol system protein YtxJ